MAKFRVCYNEPRSIYIECSREELREHIRLELGSCIDIDTVTELDEDDNDIEDLEEYQ